MFDCPFGHDTVNVGRLIQSVFQMGAKILLITAVTAVVTVVAEEENFPFANHVFLVLEIVLCLFRIVSIIGVRLRHVIIMTFQLL